MITNDGFPSPFINKFPMIDGSRLMIHVSRLPLQVRLIPSSNSLPGWP